MFFLGLQLTEIADGAEQVFPVLSGFHALKDVVNKVRLPIHQKMSMRAVCMIR